MMHTALSNQHRQRSLGRQAHKSIKGRDNRIDVKHLPDAQLQKHDAREQAQEQTRQVAVGVPGAIQEQIFEESGHNGCNKIRIVGINNED